ncbi:hypothetical protein EZS27_001685 [termite gut metagenome]|uniref:Uncharacterized protein n=1 Tax=termite gut metagenome TaxID=433724 RepID=A0A5J4SYJ6_9ZZZZ
MKYIDLVEKNHLKKNYIRRAIKYNNIVFIGSTPVIYLYPFLTYFGK